MNRAPWISDSPELVRPRDDRSRVSSARYLQRHAGPERDLAQYELTDDDGARDPFPRRARPGLAHESAGQGAAGGTALRPSFRRAWPRKDHAGDANPRARGQRPGSADTHVFFEESVGVCSAISGG